MTVKTLIKPSQYHDSVTLMLVARELTTLPGVLDAAVVMATEANKSILKEAGLLTPAVEQATANDLVIAVSAHAGAAEAALAESEKLLQKKNDSSQGETNFRPKTLGSAIKVNPQANVSVISVAGRYAADEAWDALRHGLHVLLFSDNVSLEDEIALKTYARDHGLLLMGPGAGTAILNGVALGFANVVESGPVGIVSAAGTGLQEVSTLLAKQGVGITQGLGTGGRDLKEAVGGLMMLAALEALQTDPATKVITVVSKPPAESVAKRVLTQIASGSKPTVVCFMGGDPKLATWFANAIPAPTLQEAALLAAQAAGAKITPGQLVEQENHQLKRLAADLRTKLKPGQRYLRGLFSGGTLCYEAQVVWRDFLEERVWSNAPLNSANHMPDSTRSQGHSAVDLGEEEFTVGRPHPMIDNDLRLRRLRQEASDPAVAVIMLDVVLGYGAHPDPAVELGPAIRQARQSAGDEGRELIVVASVTGTEQDPQGLQRQVEALQAAGAVVCNSNAAAARLTGMIV
ncbi:MAG: acyl-CoA synthetase FdrA [Anaerolineae bacterium]